MYDDSDEYILYESENEDNSSDLDLTDDLPAVHRIRIHTEGDKWSMYVYADNHEFADILAPYVELDEIPSEIVLKASLAEVIESQWPKYEAMIRFRDTVMNFDTNVPKRGELDGMSAALGGWRGNAERFPPVVRLSEIYLLSKVINMPENWHMWTVADDVMTDEQYINHIRATGRAVFNTNRVSYPIGYREQRRGENFVLISTMEYIMFHINKLESTNVELYDEARMIVYGTMRNAILYSMMIDARDIHLDWRYVRYNALLTLFSSLPVHHGIVNTLATWSGSGDYNRETAIGPNCKYPEVTCENADIATIYDLCLNSIPEDVHPFKLGLIPLFTQRKVLLSRRYDMEMSEMSYWVTVMNFNTITYLDGGYDKYGDEARELTEENFPLTIELILASTPGEEGLRRMVKSLEANINLNKNCGNKRVLYFIALAKERLNRKIKTNRVNLNRNNKEIAALLTSK